MAAEKEVIIITGCSGRIGFKAAERFASTFEIVGFDVQLAGHLPNVEFIIVDLASDESVKEGLAKVRKDYGTKIASVIHLAAYYSFTQEHSSNYDRITVQGTERLLKGLQDFDVEQFIFSSTMLVHAPTAPGQKVNEESPVVARWAYPESKIKTEKIIKELHGNIPYVVMRIAGVYDDKCHSIPISHQIQRIYENQLESHLFSGDLTHGASFMHMDDLIEALWLAVQKRKTLPKELILEIGEAETLSYDNLQKQIAKLIHGVEWKTVSVPKPLARIGAWFLCHIPFLKPSFVKPWMIDIADDHYELDITKAKQVLGWEPKRRLKETLPLMIQELKKDPRTWYDENSLKFSYRIVPSTSKHE